MMIPGNAIIISNYLTVSGWGLLKQPYTLWPLILPVHDERVLRVQHASGV